MMPIVFTDGGRADAGFKGEARDCVARAVSIVTGKLYQEVYDELNALAKKERRSKRRRRKSNARTGIWRCTTRRYLTSLGFTWTPTMAIGQGCKVHLRADELPPGKLIVKVSKHFCAVIDGVIYDTWDPSREGTRCVYGFWQKNGEVECEGGSRMKARVAGVLCDIERTSRNVAFVRPSPNWPIPLVAVRFALSTEQWQFLSWLAAQPERTR